jgi:cell division protein FtsZ
MAQKTFEFAMAPEGATRPDVGVVVVGVGGGGGNAVNTMAGARLRGVRLVAANTDLQALLASSADETLAIGQRLTRGHGAGARPEVGRDAAEESRDALRAAMEGAEVVFVTAGMGGGTGTGAAPVVAGIAKELGALTVGVVTRPFRFEGKRRARAADEGIEALRAVADTVFVIPNERLFGVAGDDMGTLDAFHLADRVLLDAVRGMVELIRSTGVVNADFADVRTVMSFPGLAIMAMGSATGDLRAVEAAQRAISSPLLEEVSIAGARGVLVNLTSGPGLKLRELHDAVGLIYEEADEDAEVIFGWVIDPELGDEVRVTVIATGFQRAAEPPRLPADPPRVPIERLLRVERPTPISMATPVTPWANVHTHPQFDLPPAVRESRAGRPERPLLDRQVQDAMALSDDDMPHLDAPAYVRKLAD